MNTGEVQCMMFYCDPMNSNQKSECEKNHEFIRYVIPKGKTMDHSLKKEASPIWRRLPFLEWHIKPS